MPCWNDSSIIGEDGGVGPPNVDAGRPKMNLPTHHSSTRRGKNEAVWGKPGI